MKRYRFTTKRIFVCAAVAVVAALAIGAAQGSAFFGLCGYGYPGTPCPPPYSGYTGYGGGTTNPPPPVHFTQTPDSSTTSQSATFNWEPDAAPPKGTQFNYDCTLDGQAVHDSGSSFECHPPKTVSAGVGDHVFSVAVAGPHGSDGPAATYHWTVTQEQTQTTTTSTGTETTPVATPAGGGTPPPPDSTPPKVTLTFGGKVLTDLQALLLKGTLPVIVSCNEPCTIDITAFIDSATAKRLGLISRQVAVGKGHAALAKAGKATVRVKFTKKARKQMRKAKRIKMTLKVKVRDHSGNARTLTKKIVLKRKKH